MVLCSSASVQVLCMLMSVAVGMCVFGDVSHAMRLGAYHVDVVRVQRVLAFSCV